MAAAERDASSPVPWPPIIYGSATVAAGVLGWLVPWHFEADGFRNVGLVLGLLVGGLGLLAGGLAGRRFIAAGTPIPPDRPTKTLVFDGVFQYTRNPMYLGFTLLLICFGLVFDDVWFFVAAPVAVFAVTKLAIEREEVYLERKFGAAYLSYKERVRRWI